VDGNPVTESGSDLWVSGKEVPISIFRKPSPGFAFLRDEAVPADLEAMSADAVLTRNAGTGPVVTHEPGSDLHLLQ
jgi:hypothetical protein